MVPPSADGSMAKWFTFGELVNSVRNAVIND